MITQGMGLEMEYIDYTGFDTNWHKKAIDLSPLKIRHIMLEFFMNIIYKKSPIIQNGRTNAI